MGIREILNRLFGRPDAVSEITGRTSDASSLPISAGGSGDSTDVDLVRAQFAMLPPLVIDEIVRSGIKVIACQNNVVDYQPDLRDVHPDGWEVGKTWRDVPGAYLPGKRQIVVATLSDTTGRRRVPRRGEMHGSWSLAVHELLHGFDDAEGTASRAKRFRQAWKADEGVIDDERGSSYFLNETWGPRESFAESGARKFGIDGNVGPHWPALLGYWDEVIGGRTMRDTLLFEGLDHHIEGDTDAYIGTAYQDDAGALVLNLIAKGPGIEGHAQFKMPEADRARIKSRLVPAQGALLNEGLVRRDQWLVKRAAK